MSESDTDIPFLRGDGAREFGSVHFFLVLVMSKFSDNVR